MVKLAPVVRAFLGARQRFALDPSVTHPAIARARFDLPPTVCPSHVIVLEKFIAR